jgi:hypothetical protein
VQLYNGEVPDDKAWAVVTSYASNPSEKYLEWFITPSESSARYRDAVRYIKENTQGEVTRWMVTLPARRMANYDVQAFVYQNLIVQTTSVASRLDVFKSP